MYKIMIADDEHKIRQGISKYIENMDIDLDLVATARDGEEANILAKETQPDILLLDINMPFLNGLELVEKIKDLRSDMKIIIITGFGEFNYAQKAVELGVFSYLLKPVSRDDLEQVIIKAIDELEKSRQHNREHEFATQQIKKRKSILLEQSLQDIVKGNLVENEVRRVLDGFGVNLNVRYDFILLKAKADKYNMHDNVDISLRFKLLRKVKEVIVNTTNTYVFSDEEENVFLLSDNSRERNNRIIATLKDEVTNCMDGAIFYEKVEVVNLVDLKEKYDYLTSLVFEKKEYSPIVNDALNYIAKHYVDPNLGLIEVADYLNITSTYLSRLMKSELGVSFSPYLVSVRINHALALLDQGLLIKDVATKVGYGSPFYFSTVFKKVVQMSPLDYIKERNE